MEETEETKEYSSLEEELVEKTKKTIKEVIEDDISPENLDDLGKLVDIYKDVKEVECMNYGNYNGYGNYGNYNAYGNYNGRGPSRGSYGENYGRSGYGNYGEGSYGRRVVDSIYRGEEELDRMHGEYGRYQENRNRYGAGDETDKSFHYMVEAYKDFTKVLFEEAETPQQKQMLREAIQQSMM